MSPCACAAWRAVGKYRGPEGKSFSALYSFVRKNCSYGHGQHQMSYTMPCNSMPYAQTIPNRPRQRRPHNAQSVPGDVLPVLADRLGSLAETKVAMTPTAPALLPNGAPHPSPSEGWHCCQGWPIPGSGKDIQAREHCSGPALCPTTQESMSFPNPMGDAGICSENRTNRRGLDSASLRLATVWVTPTIMHLL